MSVFRCHLTGVCVKNVNTLKPFKPIKTNVSPLFDQANGIGHKAFFAAYKT